MKVKEIPFLEIKLYDEEGNEIITEDVDFKSELIVGNIYIRLTQKFNWFQRFMLKIVFGLNIHNI
jgi:hypothetical protein